MIEPYGFQLFSAREFPPIDAQLQTVAALGFRNVEPYRLLYDNPAEARAMLDRHNLVARTGHFALLSLQQEFERHVEAARILGIKRIIVPSLPPEERVKDVAGWKELGHQLGELRHKVGEAGFDFAWHNHDFEFVRLEDGSMAIEHVLGETIDWQVDIVWIARAGHDPLHWLKKFSGRVKSIHFKDLAPAGEKLDEAGWADPETGILPWDEYWAAAIAAGAETAIAEHDMPKDYKRFATNAIARLYELTGDTA